MKGWQVMFTGRIDEIGQIDSVIDERIMVRAPKSAGRVRAGGSLNVAGSALRPRTSRTVQ
jgi:riboflavin synthase alpha subunit